MSALLLACAACGGSSGGSGDGAGSESVLIEGTVSAASAGGRVLGAGQGGLGGVTVSALGDSSVTDENGNFSLVADGTVFPGGAVEFALAGEGMQAAVALDGVPGGPGALAYVDFFVETDGTVTGQSTDAAGNVLGTTPGGRLNCDSVGTFVDGGGGALWKPRSESHGTAVILMPPDYRHAEVEVLNNVGDVVDGPLRRTCCEHNGGRAHVYLRRTSSSLAGAGIPLTVRFTFPDGRTDCREVPNPNQRYD